MTDKLLRLLAGIAIAAVVYPFGILWACLAVCLVAIGKEAYDTTNADFIDVNNCDTMLFVRVSFSDSGTFYFGNPTVYYVDA